MKAAESRRVSEDAASRTDRREQRRLDAAAGLVPFACKLPADLVRSLQERAAAHDGGLNALVAELLRQGCAERSAAGPRRPAAAAGRRRPCVRRPSTGGRTRVPRTITAMRQRLPPSVHHLEQLRTSRSGVSMASGKISTSSSSAPAAAACARRAWPRSAARASRSPRRPRSAAPASTSAASRRSSTASRRTIAEAFEDAAGFGWTVAPPRFDWDVLKAQPRGEITRLNGVYERLLDDAGVTLLRGRARLRRAGRGRGRRRRTTAPRTSWSRPAAARSRRTFPAASSRSRSNEMFDLPEFPRRLVVVGGGYIACEFASIFQRPRRAGDAALPRRADPARLRRRRARLPRRRRCARRASMLRTARAGRCASSAAAARCCVTLRDGTVLRGRHRALRDRPARRTPPASASRKPACALTPRRRGRRRRALRDQRAGIHAIGDVIDRVQLTPVAIAEAMALVDRLFGAAQRRASTTQLIPTAVFTHPSIGTVGLAEAEARERFGDGASLPQRVQARSSTRCRAAASAR